ncbi:MAG: chromosomal replication initiator protein DnaA [Ruminococcaceae bacterium]|nr:chromosomal replication initiator protein DnaA [Oscillospiraceae bacterium]
MNSFNDVFVAVKEQCRKNIVEASFNLFIEPLELDRIEDNTAFITTNSEWAKGIIEERFSFHIKKAFEEILGFTLMVKIEVKEQDEGEVAKPINGGQYALTFDTFIIGSSNKFAHAAALAVAQNPATAYNPLFIYGDSGLGKTHLLKAIEAEVLKNNPKANVIYVDGETFTNEIVTAIRENKTNEFHNKYRQVDVLLVDDIQFIAGRERTQEEFFHTFNALHNAGKQIVLVSDRPAKEIKSLEDRLRTRFEWGLTADIQAPDFETRCAIIKRKADLLRLDIKNDAVEFIAGKVKTNIRQLEGVVKKLDALKRLENKPPILVNAQIAVKDILNEELPVPVTIEKIIEEVSRSYSVAPSDVKGKKRTQNIAEARKMAMYIVRQVCELSMEDIGKEFGGRDHSTVVYSISNVEEKMEKDSFYRGNIEDIIKNIKTL